MFDNPSYDRNGPLPKNTYPSIGKEKNNKKNILFPIWKTKILQYSIRFYASRKFLLCATINFSWKKVTFIPNALFVPAIFHTYIHGRKA